MISLLFLGQRCNDIIDEACEVHSIWVYEFVLLSSLTLLSFVASNFSSETPAPQQKVENLAMIQALAACK